ncbi:MAG: hypothetical protein R2761_02735 [Acidimicrobiales bacterium]
MIETCRSAVGRLAGTAVVLSLLVAACGSGGDDSSAPASAGASPVSAATEPGASSADGEAGGTTATPPDACALVSDEAASALLGQEVTGKAASVENAPYAVCQWGDLFQGDVLAVQVAGEQDTIRPLQILVSASSQDATASSVGTDGKYIADIGYVYGGGGVGQSILFRHGEWDVLVGVTGEDGPSQAELEAVAADIDAALS